MGGFLQTSSASVVRKLSIEMDSSPVDRDRIVAFLSNSVDSEYAPRNGTIIGILKQMLDTMSADLADCVTKEK